MRVFVAILILLLPLASAFGQGSTSVKAPPLPEGTGLGEPRAIVPIDGPPPTASEEGQEGTPNVTTAGPTPTPDPNNPFATRFQKPPQGQAEAIASGMAPLDPIGTIEKPVARVRALDKMTGEIVTVVLRVGEGQRLLRLLVALDACQAPKGDDIRGTRAFVRIWDTKGGENTPLFSGWMFADSPALSALDHPRYDVWVLGCLEA